MSMLEETKEFLQNKCIANCGHNANESCICTIAICFKEIEKAQEQEKFLDDKLVFENGHIMSGFDYKDKQIVAMPLDEYSRLMEQEEVLKIVFEKRVNIDLLNGCDDVYEYNIHFPFGEIYQLTQKEFVLIKRYYNE